MSEKNGQETAAVQPPCPAGEELVSYTAPLLPWRNERDIFVSVNGESIRIKRGETVQIRRKFLEVIENAQRQEGAAYAYMAEAKRAVDKPMAAL